MASMQVPTERGDILILQSVRGMKIHAVGRVTTRGQQDFEGVNPAPIYIVDHQEAITAAQVMAVRGQRIFLVKIDNREWSEVSS
jgi:hypothetical protein